MIFIIGGAYDGQAGYASGHFPKAEIIGNYHLRIKEQLQGGLEPMEEVKKLLQSFCEKDREIVIWSCEIGCGLVPVDASDRAFRECTGRVHCYLAEQASEVIRMVCGIGTVLCRS